MSDGTVSVFVPIVAPEGNAGANEGKLVSPSPATRFLVGGRGEGEGACRAGRATRVCEERVGGSAVEAFPPRPNPLPRPQTAWREGGCDDAAGVSGATTKKPAGAGFAFPLSPPERGRGEGTDLCAFQ